MLASLHAILPGGFLSGHFAAISATVFIAALLQGISGLGFAMVSAPVAVLFFPELVPGPLLVLGAGLALLGVIREYSDVDWPSTGALMAGRIVGTAAAGLTLSILPTTLFGVVFAFLILAGVGLSFAGWRIDASIPNMVVAGLASGLMGTITSSGAPPFAIVMQHVQPARMRATVGCVFFARALLSLVTLGFVGHFSIPQLWLGLILLPVMMVGFVSSGPLNRFVSRATLRHMLLIFSALGALGILVRAWVATG
jgi:uncharacterized membrane protein YfcA